MVEAMEREGLTVIISFSCFIPLGNVYYVICIGYRAGIFSSRSGWESSSFEVVEVNLEKYSS